MDRDACQGSGAGVGLVGPEQEEHIDTRCPQPLRAEGVPARLAPAVPLQPRPMRKLREVRSRVDLASAGNHEPEEGGRQTRKAGVIFVREAGTRTKMRCASKSRVRMVVGSLLRGDEAGEIDTTIEREATSRQGCTGRAGIARTMKMSTR